MGTIDYPGNRDGDPWIAFDEVAEEMPDEHH
jgi:hypothetical protein